MAQSGQAAEMMTCLRLCKMLPVEFAPVKGSPIGELAATFNIVLGVTPELMRPSQWCFVVADGISRIPQIGIAVALWFSIVADRQRVISMENTHARTANHNHGRIVDAAGRGDTFTSHNIQIREVVHSRIFGRTL
jgi:hypothetical protein